MFNTKRIDSKLAVLLLLLLLFLLVLLLLLLQILSCSVLGIRLKQVCCLFSKRRGARCCCWCCCTYCKQEDDYNVIWKLIVSFTVFLSLSSKHCGAFTITFNSNNNTWSVWWRWCWFYVVASPKSKIPHHQTMMYW